MATMTSMLARASRSALAACRASRAAALASARAARSAAAARRAAAAVSRASRSSTAAAAAADLASDSDSSREARSFRCDDKLQTPVVDEEFSEFVVDEEDLESDEALWALYERWCKHFNEERDRDEMARWFGEFKRTVLLVHQENNSDRPYELAINQFADGKMDELCLGGSDAFLQEAEQLAKLPKKGVEYIWINGKYYMEVPEECQPESPYQS